MGIMDNVLRPHHQAVTKAFNGDKAKWVQMHQRIKLEQQRPSMNRADCDKAAERFQEQGNKFLETLDYCNAQLMYTNSITAALNGPMASLAYFNRSEALFHMRLYEDCIKDVDRALASGYPKPQNLFKLFLMKAKCMKVQGISYKDTLAEATKAMDDYNKDDATRPELELEMDKPEPTLIAGLPASIRKWKLPELSYGQNHEVPCFSGAVSLKYDKKLGRHLIANKNINTGDVLIVEESIASSIRMDKLNNFCNFCFKYNLALIPCIKCSNLLYCSEECRDADCNHMHYSNCSYDCHCSADSTEYDKTLKQQCEFFPIRNRLIASIGLDKITHAALENQPMPSLLGDPRTNGFHDGKLQTLEAMLSHEDKFDELDDTTIKMFADVSIHHTVLLQVPQDQWLPIAAVLMKLFLVMQGNFRVITCSIANFNTDPSLTNRDLGLGMFVASSLINHSCDHNMYPVWYGNSVVFRARRPIKKGEQLTHSYIMLSGSALAIDCKDRQSTIMDAYKFKCSCSSCVSKFPNLGSLPQYPERNYMTRWFKKSGLAKEANTLKFFTSSYKLLATKSMLPKLLALLEFCQRSKQKSTQWYYNLQETIQNHYRTEGSCLFYDDCKELMDGEKQFKDNYEADGMMLVHHTLRYGHPLENLRE